MDIEGLILSSVIGDALGSITVGTKNSMEIGKEYPIKYYCKHYGKYKNVLKKYDYSYLSLLNLSLLRTFNSENYYFDNFLDVLREDVLKYNVQGDVLFNLLKNKALSGLKSKVNDIELISFNPSLLSIIVPISLFKKQDFLMELWYYFKIDDDIKDLQIKMLEFYNNVIFDKSIDKKWMKIYFDNTNLKNNSKYSDIFKQSVLNYINTEHYLELIVKSVNDDMEYSDIITLLSFSYYGCINGINDCDVKYITKLNNNKYIKRVIDEIQIRNA